MITYYGIYPAYVVKNDEHEADPVRPRTGRVCVAVPDVYGDITDSTKLPWARICVPAYGGGNYSPERGAIDTKEKGKAVGSGLLAIPPVGTTGFVIFEQGDPQWPVWLGTWYGKEQELPAAALADPTQGVTFPKILLLASPYAPDMHIRFSGDRQIEIAVGNYMSVRLIAETSENAADNKVQVTAIRGNVEINALAGDLSVIAKNISLVAENDVNIYAGRYKKLADGSTEVETVGNMRLQATNENVVSGETLVTIQAVKKDAGEIQGRAANASGFEKHGNNI